jgi:hypothetical protein
MKKLEFNFFLLDITPNYNLIHLHHHRKNLHDHMEEHPV